MKLTILHYLQKFEYFHLLYTYILPVKVVAVTRSEYLWMCWGDMWWVSQERKWDFSRPRYAFWKECQDYRNDIDKHVFLHLFYFAFFACFLFEVIRFSWTVYYLSQTPVQDNGFVEEHICRLLPRWGDARINSCVTETTDNRLVSCQDRKEQSSGTFHDVGGNTANGTSWNRVVKTLKNSFRFEQDVQCLY